MTDNQWLAFCSFRDAFKNRCKVWSEKAQKFEISKMQREAADKDEVPFYPIENPVVYNTALNEITCDDEIKLIVIGDNPGKAEQLDKNMKYLVGLSGKIAAGFFKKNPSLSIDFRKNVIILNKTPVHSAKTKELLFMYKQNNKNISELIEESQIWMAQKTAELHTKLGCDLWLVGYAELKKKGVFTQYRDELKKAYTQLDVFNRVYVFQHFSMNRFSIDLKAKTNTNMNLIENIHAIGTLHRNEIFI